MSKTVEQLVTEMNNRPVTLEQLQKLSEDKTPVGHAAYLAAAAQFTEHAGSSATRIMMALLAEDTAELMKRENIRTAASAVVIVQSKKLDEIEETLESTLHHVRAANAALRAAARRPWWMRFFCF